MRIDDLRGSYIDIAKQIIKALNDLAERVKNLEDRIKERREKRD